jgi:hypothetical protein
MEKARGIQMEPGMSDLLQFGPFKLVLPDGDLYKGGTRVRLQQHPLTLLILLGGTAGRDRDSGRNPE